MNEDDRWTTSKHEWTPSKNHTQADTDTDEESQNERSPSKNDTQTDTDTDTDEESKKKAWAYSKGWRSDWKASDSTFLKRIAVSACVSMQ